MMQRGVLVLLLWMGIGAGMAAGALAEEGRTATAPSMEGRKEVIIQIFGRFCEYDRDEVEAVLQRHGAVDTARFLNNHGTVLVRYRSEMVTANQLAAAIERVLPIGVGCRVQAG